MTDDNLVARIDESSREAGNGLMYVMGAAVVLRGDEAAARQALEGLRLHGQRYLHWQSESDERRRFLLDSVVDLGFVAFAVASHPVGRRRQERARARNLKRLGHWLSREEGIQAVVIESRAALLDRRDAITFHDARRQGTVDPNFHFEHARKSDDPLLWAADIITSAQALDLTTADHEYWEVLQKLVVDVRWVDP